MLQNMADLQVLQELTSSWLNEKKKRIRTIESVPLYLADKIDKDSSELERYCDKLGLVNYDIRVRKIKIGSLLNRNGYFAYLTGKTGKQLILRNATNLCLDKKWKIHKENRKI